MQRDDSVYLKHIRDAILTIAKYTNHLLLEQKRFGAGKLTLSNNVRDRRYDRVIFCTV